MDGVAFARWPTDEESGRIHIASYAAGTSYFNRDPSVVDSNCVCHNGTHAAPDWIGEDYFCDSPLRGSCEVSRPWETHGCVHEATCLEAYQSYSYSYEDPCSSSCESLGCFGTPEKSMMWGDEGYLCKGSRYATQSDDFGDQQFGSFLKEYDRFIWDPIEARIMAGERPVFEDVAVRYLTLEVHGCPLSGEPTCGNGIVEAPEQCDSGDGSNDFGRYCSIACTTWNPDTCGRFGNCDVICDAGAVASGSGCELCPAGTQSSSGASKCVACDVGTISSEGAASCEPCPDPRWTSNSSSSVCDSCQAAYILTGASDAYCWNLECGSPEWCEAEAVCYSFCCDAHGECCDEIDAGECVACHEGMLCPTPNMLLESVAVKPGWWRWSANSAVLTKCERDENCPGSFAGRDSFGDALCDDNSKGYLCNECEARFYLGEDGKCRRCRDWRFLIIATAVALSFAGLAYAYRRTLIACMRCEHLSKTIWADRDWWITSCLMLWYTAQSHVNSASPLEWFR